MIITGIYVHHDIRIPCHHCKDWVIWIEKPIPTQHRVMIGKGPQVENQFLDCYYIKIPAETAYMITGLLL